MQDPTLLRVRKYEYPDARIAFAMPPRIGSQSIKVMHLNTHQCNS